MSPAVELAVIIAAGLLSGFVNTLASRGSAVTLPLMILIGLPATVANGTNRLPLLAGSIAALVTRRAWRLPDPGAISSGGRWR